MEQKDYVMQIKENYAPHGRTKLDELKALDKKVKLPPTVTAYILGTVAALIFGVGMCLAMKVIGSALAPATQTALGVITGCIGIALCIADYFIYSAMLKSRKKKYGAQIIAVSDELLNK